MKKILLVDFDSKIPNLALMKLSSWHKSNGDKVGFDIDEPDLVYVSVIYTKNRSQALGLTRMYPKAEVILGGSGIGLDNTLPAEVDLIKPDYDLYPSTYSQGFTSRGCIRKCPFCIVPKKEGHIQSIQHPSEFHDVRFDTCMIMDNNLLATGHKWLLSVFDWFIKNDIKMDVTQGLDIRLLTKEYADYLKEIKHPKGLRFAWDNIKDEKAILKGIDILEYSGFNLKHDISFYVLGGYDSTFEEDLYRCNKLRDRGVNSFVMRFHKNNPKLNQLAKWANRRWAYWSRPFELSAIRGGL